MFKKVPQKYGKEYVGDVTDEKSCTHRGIFRSTSLSRT